MPKVLTRHQILGAQYFRFYPTDPIYVKLTVSAWRGRDYVVTISSVIHKVTALL